MTTDSSQIDFSLRTVNTCVGTEAGLAQEFPETFFEQLLLLAISVA